MLLVRYAVSLRGKASAFDHDLPENIDHPLPELNP
jgi:hypothetical protein